jgi:hypothetical protein
LTRKDLQSQTINRSYKSRLVILTKYHTYFNKNTT